MAIWPNCNLLSVSLTTLFCPAQFGSESQCRIERIGRSLTGLLQRSSCSGIACSNR